MPVGQIGQRAVLGKASPITRRGIGVRPFEADELQIELANEPGDLRQGEALLLDMEDEIAAGAQAVEILAAGHPHEERIVRSCQDGGAAGAYAFGRRREAPRRDELAGANDVPARDLAVETDAHHAARAQQRAKDSPAGHRVLEVMQHAGAIDDVEAFGQRAQRQDVGLPVFDVADPELACLARRVGEARQAQIDGQHARIRESPRRADRMPSGAAARDEDSRRRVGYPGEIRLREIAAQKRPDRRRRNVASQAQPSGIGIGLVLTAHRRRNPIDHLGQYGDRPADAPFLLWLADLPQRERGEHRGREFGGDRVGRIEGVQRTIAGVERVPVERHRAPRRTRGHDRAAQFGDIRSFLVGFVVHVLGVEALERNRRDGGQWQRGCRVTVLGEFPQQAAARERDQALDEDVRHHDFLEQAVQQRVGEQSADERPQRRPCAVVARLEFRQAPMQLDRLGSRGHEARDRAHQTRRIDRGVAERAEQQVADAWVARMPQVVILDAMLELHPVRRVVA